jgi:succinyl-diaminopimelate desuccinylase
MMNDLRLKIEIEVLNLQLPILNFRKGSMQLTINTQQVIDDTIALIAIDSQNLGALETACSAWLYGRLKKMGLGVVVQHVQAGRDNLIAVVKGTGEAPRLVLSAHMDTVPVGVNWTMPGLRATIRDGNIYGRGSADMKSGLAVGLGVMEALAKTEKPRGDIVLALSVDEEGPAMAGIHALVKAGYICRGDNVIALEPTGLRLRIAHTGVHWLKITTYGKMSHAGRAHLGIDAVHVMAKAINTLKEKVAALPFEDALLGKPHFTCGVIEGGVATNVVPGSCKAHFDLRLIPPMDITFVKNIVGEVLEQTIQDFPGSRFEVEPLDIPRPPVKASDESPIVTGLHSAYQQVTKQVLESGGADGHEAYTDAAMVAALTGSTNCVAFGPGSSDVAHTSDEYVPMSDVDTACRVMETLVSQW